MMDYFAMYCLSFLGIVWIMYSAIFSVLYKNLRKEIYRQQVLNLRIALCLPLYSLIFYLSLYFPSAIDFLYVGVVFVEGLTICTFFSLLVENVGGSARILVYMTEAGGIKPKIFKSMYPKVSSLFYRGLIRRLWHCIVTRTVFAVTSAVLFSFNLGITRIISVILNVISTLVLLTAVVWLMLLYELLYSWMKNLNGISKLFMIKTSVGISAILHNISVVLTATIGGYKMTLDTENYDATNSTKRAYCTMMLLIFALYALLFFHPFAKTMALPTSGADEASPYNSSGDGKDTMGEAPMNISIQQFLLDIIQITDIRKVIISYDTKHIVPEERENQASTLSDACNSSISMNCNEKEIIREDLESNALSKM